MTISYRWLSEYLPQNISPEKLSHILTSIGLEVESLEKFENFKGGLAGLVVGEVMEVIKHPGADKLKLTKVNIGAASPLHIVCGASNVAQGQKVVVATVGTTIYPTSGEPLTMKLAKIRGEQSEGMICAEDEIGISDDHQGIIVLDATTPVGTPVASLYESYEDWIYEIGLTPNRMDAMSHFGVARDVCAYLSYHESLVQVISPFKKKINVEASIAPFKIQIEDSSGCKRYSGIVIDGVKVKESPSWLKNKLQAIGVRSINNIVDITNYVLHETGQPLHAFDAAAIKDKTIVVKKYPAGTKFTTLDGVERTLTSQDLMISDTQKPLCIAGVFGGLNSGVSATTTQIFLESALFDNVHIRKTSLHHGLRTDAATRFEKGVAIDGTVSVLEHAAQLIQTYAGGKCSAIVDSYPLPATKTIIHFDFAYLKKLSGKVYEPAKVKTILISLGFEIVKENTVALEIAVPYHKPDISIAADIVEEIVRIDGLDNIAIPSAITMSPANDPLEKKEKFKDKIAQYLVGRGFTEILTNSITNSAYYTEEVVGRSVKMLNNLTAELDLMRPSMLETGLEAIAYNSNRKNNSISFFEIGKIYGKSETGKYYESEQLALYLAGKQNADGWRLKALPADFFVAKGIATALCQLLGLPQGHWQSSSAGQVNYVIQKSTICTLESVSAKKLQSFGIKQAVFYIHFDLTTLFSLYQNQQVVYKEVSKYPSVERDIALVIPAATPYAAIEQSIEAVKLKALQQSSVFDIFESEKLGAQKKSVAINFVFNAVDKTLTDMEIDAMMKKLVKEFENNLQAEIRK